jgi:hypothetical protein
VNTASSSETPTSLVRNIDVRLDLEVVRTHRRAGAQLAEDERDDPGDTDDEGEHVGCPGEAQQPSRPALEIPTKPSGSPAMVSPTMRIARPRKMSMPARVTMKAGTPT